MSSEPIGRTVLADGALHVDETHFPVVMLKWFGAPSRAAVEAYRAAVARAVERARGESTRIFIIGDPSEAERPGPEARRELSQLATHIADEHGDRLLGGATIIPNALMRAAFIMVMSMSRRSLGFRPVKGLDRAVALAFEALDAAGIERPPTLVELARGRPTG